MTWRSGGKFGEGEGLEDGRGRGQEEDGAAALLAGPGEGADHLAAGLAEDGGAALGGQGDGLVKDNGKVIDAGGGDGAGYHSKTQGGGPVFVGEPNAFLDLGEGPGVQFENSIGGHLSLDRQKQVVRAEVVGWGVGAAAAGRSPTPGEDGHRGLSAEVQPSGFQEGRALGIDEVATGDGDNFTIRRLGEEAGALVRGSISAPDKHGLKKDGGAGGWQGGGWDGEEKEEEHHQKAATESVGKVPEPEPGVDLVEAWVRLHSRH